MVFWVMIDFVIIVFEEEIISHLKLSSDLLYSLVKLNFYCCLVSLLSDFIFTFILLFISIRNIAVYVLTFDLIRFYNKVIVLFSFFWFLVFFPIVKLSGLLLWVISEKFIKNQVYLKKVHNIWFHLIIIYSLVN